MSIRISYLIPIFSLLIPALAGAAEPAASEETPAIDCSSAAPPIVDYKTLNRVCRARAAKERAAKSTALTDEPALASAAVAAADVMASRMTLAAMEQHLRTAYIPSWSDGDILAHFATSRDARYMEMSNVPDFPRRISWMYPDDGCFARADQVDVRVAQAGKTRPYKLFVFGRASEFEPLLRFYTDNAPTGVVKWTYHVAPVVRNSANEVVVLDAALSPCRPLPWKEWLELMVDDLGIFADIGGLDSEKGLTLADSFAYDPYSVPYGEPSHEAQSRTYVEGYLLWMEWSRQEYQMGRDPYVVLGASPPWSGYNCVSVDTRQSMMTLAPGASGTVTATCPFATRAVGGGMWLGSPQSFTASKNAMSGNGWQITAKNVGSSTASFSASAVCLVGSQDNTQVSTIQGNVVSINPNSYSTSSASCGTATLVGGGYTTTQGSTSVMRIYNNARSSSNGNTWQVSAFNTTGTAKSLTAFAYCLPSTGLTYSQSSVGIGPGGLGFVLCSPKNVLGGGFSFPRTSNYQVNGMQATDSTTYLVTMTSVPSGGDPNAKAYAECLTHP
jgi:hypothetical protein